MIYSIIIPTTGIILLVLFFLGLYILIRNLCVSIFRKYINALCYEYSIKNIDDVNDCAYKWCYNKLPSYEKMLFSFKPLKLGHWLTEEQITKLTSLQA